MPGGGPGIGDPLTGQRSIECPAELPATCWTSFFWSQVSSASCSSVSSTSVAFAESSGETR